MYQDFRFLYRDGIRGNSRKAIREREKRIIDAAAFNLVQTRRDARAKLRRIWLAAAHPIKAVSFVISGYINGISGGRVVDLPIFW